MKSIRILFAAALFSFSFANFAQGYQPGDIAADFSLKNIDGKNMSLRDFKDAKGIIVIFTCNHCPFAVLYEDRIVALNNKYASQGYPVVAINPNDVTKEPADSYENMQKRAKEKNFTFPYLYDDTQAIAKAYGASRTPHVYLLRKNATNFTVEFIGAIDDNAQDAGGVKERFLENAIEELKANKAVSKKSVKAIGCTIKWKS
ncbi:MAG: thioredoxin family protein [Cytophagales bacterium]